MLYNDDMDKLTGIALATSATILYALLFPLFKKAGDKVPPFAVMMVSTFTLFLCALIASLFFESSFYKKGGFTQYESGLLIITGLINLIAFWLSLLAYKHMPIWQYTMFGLMTPVVTGIFAYYILGEKISANLFIGLAIMAVGLFVAVRP